MLPPAVIPLAVRLQAYYSFPSSVNDFLSRSCPTRNLFYPLSKIGRDSRLPPPSLPPCLSIFALAYPLRKDGIDMPSEGFVGMVDVRKETN